MTDISKATPRPWFRTDGDIWVDTREQVCCGRGYQECCGEPDVIGGKELIAQTGSEDAALIVTAVNAYEPMLEALKAARACYGTEHGETLDAINAAIALAEKGGK